MRRLMDEEWILVREFAPDVIVRHPKSIASPHIAEALTRPAILASPLPGFTPTSAFPTPLLPFATLGPFNRVSHTLAIHGAGLLFGNMIRDWLRETLGLAPSSRGERQQAGTLYAYSLHVLPVPADWKRDVLVSGYWFLDGDHWEPPRDLVAFLEAGEPPVYIGFGSMPGLEPRPLTSMVIDALIKTGKRGGARDRLWSAGETGRSPKHSFRVKRAAQLALSKDSSRYSSRRRRDDRGNTACRKTHGNLSVLW